MAATSSSSMSGSYSLASSIFAFSGSGTVSSESARPLGSRDGTVTLVEGPLPVRSAPGIGGASWEAMMRPSCCRDNRPFSPSSTTKAAPARPTSSWDWAWPPASGGCVGGLHNGRRPGSRVDGGQGREKAAESTEATVAAQPADHRRTGLRPTVSDRRGATLRGLQPALRAGLHPGDTNLPFDEWTEVFGSERLTGALLDRLTHYVHILEMNGESYRLKRSRENAASQVPDDPDEE